MSESRILLLGASGSGSETLKNLILPQIQEFTIVDDAKVTARDVGQNFFLTDDKIGSFKAEVMCENLLELNPEDTKAIPENVSIDAKLNQESFVWGSKYDLVIGSDLTNQQAVRASQKCREGDRKIPFVLLRQYGLIGSIRLDVGSLYVVEKKEYQVEE